MTLKPLAAAAIMLTASAPAGADTRSEARAQVQFGIAVAQRELWREAIYRWERAVQLDPTYAAAYNNLGVAYEREGMLEKAKAAYEKALALDPMNAVIRDNYERFKDIHEHQTPQSR